MKQDIAKLTYELNIRRKNSLDNRRSHSNINLLNQFEKSHYHLTEASTDNNSFISKQSPYNLKRLSINYNKENRNFHPIQLIQNPNKLTSIHKNINHRHQDYGITQISYEIKAIHESFYSENQQLKRDMETLIDDLHVKNATINDLINKQSHSCNKDISYCYSSTNQSFNTKEVHQQWELILNQTMKQHERELIHIKTYNQDLLKELDERSFMFNRTINRLTLELNEKSNMNKILEEKLTEYEQKMVLKDANVQQYLLNEEKLIRKIEALTMEIKRVKMSEIRLENYLCLIEGEFHSNHSNINKLHQVNQAMSISIPGVKPLKKTIDYIAQHVSKINVIGVSKKIIDNKTNSLNGNDYKEKIELSLSSKIIKKISLNCFNQALLNTSNIHKKEFIVQEQQHDPNNIILSPLDNKTILLFNTLTDKFQSYTIADYTDYSIHYIHNNALYYSIKSNLYVITGKSCNLFYLYSHIQNSIVKLCPLNNNHTNGKLIYIPITNIFICLSGNYNRKVEEYNLSKNQWNNLPEMLIERSQASYTIINDTHLYAFFGYNYPTKSFIGDIEYLSLERKDKWIRINVSSVVPISLRKHISFLLTSEEESKIIIIGGKTVIDGNEIPNEYFGEIDIKNQTFQFKDRKFKDIHINKSYSFMNNSFVCNVLEKESNTSKRYFLCFDDLTNIHRVSPITLLHDVIYNEI